MPILNDRSPKRLTGAPSCTPPRLAYSGSGPARKVARPRPAIRVRVTYFDYTSNRTVAAEAPLKGPATLSVAEAGDQPLPTREE
jgi:hypothetical protein